MDSWHVVVNTKIVANCPTEEAGKAARRLFGSEAKLFVERILGNPNGAEIRMLNAVD